MNENELEAAAKDLDRRIEHFVTRSDASEAEFERLALELFAYQYHANEPYRRLCDRQGWTPESVRTWSQAPALAAASFADARVACFPPHTARLRFVSSGTTRAGERASVHELENTALYDASLLTHFRRCVLPDHEKIVMVLLSQAFDEAPHSSLAYMLSKLFAAYGCDGGFFVRDGSLDAQAAARALRSYREPVLVFGTALALADFLDYCENSQLTFELPSASRVVETGGFKGKARSIERDGLYRALSQTFGVPIERCVSEYGMCELGSQWYDANLSDALAKQTPRYALKIGAYWTRTLVVDPISACPLPLGAAGLLQVFDLSNRGSVAAVLTGDLVRGDRDGFIYLGRSPAAPPKGCSIAFDAMLRSDA